MKQYKFENWLNGDVTLIFSEVLSDGKDVNGEIVEPIRVDWENFAESERIKIMQMQKQIFDENISLNLEKFKSEFLKRHTRSLMPEEFLESEKQECFNILFSRIPIKQFVTTKHWEITFYYNDLLEIQKYAKNTILKGIEVCLDFIHSPHNKYQTKNKIPSQVYAHVLYNYFQWLESNFNLEKNDDIKNDDMIIDDAINLKTELLWFKVGLFFANGQISLLKEKYKKGDVANFTAISKELGNSNYRPYISESFSNTNINDKNIFSNNQKVKEILNYCEVNNINVSDDFTTRIKS